VFEGNQLVDFVSDKSSILSFQRIRFIFEISQNAFLARLSYPSQQFEHVSTKVNFTYQLLWNQFDSVFFQFFLVRWIFNIVVHFRCVERNILSVLWWRCFHILEIELCEKLVLWRCYACI
jgi:hypothetical protein